MSVGETIEKLIFWRRGRNSWLYVIAAGALLAAILFIPSTNNGWFKNGEQVKLADDSVVILREENARIYLELPEGAPAPDEGVIIKFISERFGERSRFELDTREGKTRYRVFPSN